MRTSATGVLDARRAAEPGVESIDELRLRLIALPAALAIAALFSRMQLGHALQRLFFGMPLHELGHALTALALGYPAFPLPWQTFVADQRSPVLVGLLLGASCSVAVLGLRAGQRAWAVVGAAVGLAVLLGLAPPPPAARALITFGGDAGALVLGALLMATVFTGPSSAFRRGALRWGLLVIGAAGFSDVAFTWWAAHRDPGEIPLGELEGVGRSDASTLVDVHRWTEQVLVSRYLWVAGICLVALVTLWALRALRPLLRERL